MKKKQLPVYKIQDFKHVDYKSQFYANDLNTHIKEHDFTKDSHKHDFYLVALIISGSGKHEIDFNSYDVKPGSVFIMYPGQTHRWLLSSDIKGIVFFHSAEFYDQGFTIERIQNYPFYNSLHNLPLVLIKGKSVYTKIKLFFEEILNEFNSNSHLKFQRMHALVCLVYIELTRIYVPLLKVKNQNYLNQVSKLVDLIDKNYKKQKFPFEYAKLMNLSEKHVNRICKECLNKTTSELIYERVTIEAKRMLIHTTKSINEIAFELGFDDNSYFSRFFKKQVDLTPKEFAEKFK